MDRLHGETIFSIIDRNLDNSVAFPVEVFKGNKTEVVIAVERIGKVIGRCYVMLK